VSNLIIGRKKVIEEAEKQINHLISRLEKIIKGAKQEYLFHIVYFYPQLFAHLAKEIVKDGSEQTYNITWLRATTGITLALNKILPKYLPLEHISTLDIKKFERTLSEQRAYFEFILISYNIGAWQYILENKYIDKIMIKDNTPYTYYPEDKVHLYMSYINKAFEFSRSEEYRRWFDIVYKNLPEDLIRIINNYLFRNYKFYLDDLARALSYLENLVEHDQGIYFYRNKIHEVFTKNIRSGRAERLIKALTFGKDKDLWRSPLIPVKKGYYLIASWVFKLKMHFHSWIYPIFEQNYERFARFVGQLFEDYVKDRIKNLADEIKSNIAIRERDYPEIRPWLEKMDKKGEFEMDILTIKGDMAFIISCKGGRKDLPRLTISRMWGEIPERDILDRINKNKEEIRELKLICECIMSNDRILRDLEICDKKIEPLVVYPSIQPLSISELREAYNIQPIDPRIVTVSELKCILTSS